MTPPSESEIAQLREEALAAGDVEMALACTRALHHRDPAALRKVYLSIQAAKAAAD